MPGTCLFVYRNILFTSDVNHFGILYVLQVYFSWCLLFHFFKVIWKFLIWILQSILFYFLIYFLIFSITNYFPYILFHLNSPSSAHPPCNHHTAVLSLSSFSVFFFARSLQLPPPIPPSQAVSLRSVYGSVSTLLVVQCVH